MIIFKCLHQTASQYLQELCIPVTVNTGFTTTCALPLVGITSACVSDCQLRTTQLCRVCSKTVEQSVVVTLESSTDTYTVL